MDLLEYLDQKEKKYIKDREEDKRNADNTGYFIECGRILAISELREFLNVGIVNERNLLIAFLDKIKEHPEIIIPYDSDIVVDKFLEGNQ